MSQPGDEIRDALRGLRVFPDGSPEFAPDDAPEDPAELFGDWVRAAVDAGVREPHAMTLSTVDEAGRPSARVLILKGFDDGRLEFATNRLSRKGRELGAAPWAAVTFHWREQGRQVRVRGAVADAGPEAAARDFLARAPASRVEAMAGRQSEVLDDPAGLEAAASEARSAIEADPELVPESWTVYQLVPDEYEFWQADPDRRHLRLSYRLDDGRWCRERLWPRPRSLSRSGGPSARWRSRRHPGRSLARPRSTTSGRAGPPRRRHRRNRQAGPA